MRLSVLFIAVALGTFALVPPHLVEAQSANEKILLMADTLRARDSGNLDLAKEKAEELIKIAPQDDNVQRLLGSINKELDLIEKNSIIIYLWIQNCLNTFDGSFSLIIYNWLLRNTISVFSFSIIYRYQ